VRHSSRAARLGKHCLGKVPQALEYLIVDAGRRHGLVDVIGVRAVLHALRFAGYMPSAHHADGTIAISAAPQPRAVAVAADHQWS
jgi:hypothetical protein